MKTVYNKFSNLDVQQLIYKEWLVANGLGGFACGSLAGIPMRKYHSLLTAALPNPYGRTIMLNYVAETLIFPDKTEFDLSLLRHDQGDENKLLLPKEFRLENGLPVWVYEVNGVIIEKSIMLVHRQNTLHMSYNLKSDQEGILLKWKPFFHLRANEDPVDREIPNESYTVAAKDSQYEIECPGFPSLKLFNLSLTPFIVQHEVEKNVFYEIEAERGYASRGSLTSPGFYISPLLPQERLSIVASTENWETVLAITPKDAWTIESMRKKSLLKVASPSNRNPFAANLILSADQFLMKPTTRFTDMIRVQALGEEIRSVIAGFPWFTDWGRDTMISLEGLTLVTGRHREAYSILYTFAHYIQDGLIPNMFPDGANRGIYNTADATLWFFHAIDRYITITGDVEILEFILPKLKNILDSHINGTLFGIKMDDDGLLVQGYQSVALTWMDAKMGDWVVTPRRGKAVEINALWYNALRLYEEWTDAPPELSTKCYESFNREFWFNEGNYLYDLLEEKGKDPALRPNQLFAISLKYPVLDQSHWKDVLDAVQKNLYTPVGLRTLSPSHLDYKETYHGDLKTRDAAYHQGSVWPWLLGPYIDVWLKVYPSDYQTAYEILLGLESHLFTNCLGTIGEIFDASPPYHARGCFAQAWSVAEILRCLVRVIPHIK